MTDRLKRIRSMWQGHCERPFPDGLPYQEPHGFDLTTADSLASGCIATFLESPQAFASDASQPGAVKECLAHINSAWTQLHSDEREYFGPLRELCHAVNAYCKTQ